MLSISTLFSEVWYDQTLLRVMTSYSKQAEKNPAEGPAAVSQVLPEIVAMQSTISAPTGGTKILKKQCFSVALLPVKERTMNHPSGSSELEIARRCQDSAMC